MLNVLLFPSEKAPLGANSFLLEQTLFKRGLVNTKANRKIISKDTEKATSTKLPASTLRKSTSGRHRPVSYPDGPMTARY